MPHKHMRCFKSKSSGSGCVCAVLNEEIISLLPPCVLNRQQNSDLAKIYSHAERKYEDLTLNVFLTQMPTICAFDLKIYFSALQG